MILHFSILALILVLGLLFERNIQAKTIPAALNEDNYNVKTSIVPWLLVFALITFYAAMRTDVNDTAVYRATFTELKPSWDNISQLIDSDQKDKGFYILQNFFKMYISDDYHMWFLLFAAIESLAFIFILRRESVSFVDAMFFFFASTLYYNYFTMMRQWFAVSLTFIGFYFFKRKKFIFYLLICLLAAQFHNSAYIMIPIYFLVQGEPWHKKQNTILIIVFLAFLFMNPLLNTLEDTTQGSTYDYAIQTMNTNSGSSIIRPIIYFVPVVLSYIFREKIIGKETNIIVNYSVFNFILNLVATFTSGLYVVRLSTYFNIYNVLLYPYLLNVALNDNKNKILIKIAFYIFYFSFYLYQMNYTNGYLYYSDILGLFGN